MENHSNHNLEKQQNNTLQQQLQQSISQDYEVLTKLGSGAYGHVWKVKDKHTQQIYALKKVFSAFQNDVDAQRTYRQIFYLQKLSKHQNIVKLIKVIKAKNQMDLYLLFQYMQSDLFYAIKEDLLNDLHKKYIIYQLAKCLKYVHSAGLVHRDVKPSNVLINPNCEIRLCDFGLSRTLWMYNNQETKLTEFIATRWYRAPQVLFGSQLYNTKSDMWSVGCLIYQLYARRPLLPGNDTVEQIQKVLEFKGFPNTQQKKSFKIPKIDEVLGLFNLQKKPLNQYFKYIQSEEVKQILIHLLQYNPQKRWTAVDLLQCSFLQQFRQFQQQIQAQKQIKTAINDNERKSVETYRNAIYNQFVYNDSKKCQNIKQKLQMIRQSKQFNAQNINRVSQTGRKTFMRSSSHDLLTEQRKPRLQNSKTMVSLHVNKGIKNSLPNTQRPNHRKNMSSHNLSKFNSEFIETCRVSKQKPVFLQMKLKKPQPKFEFNLNKSNTVTKRSTKNSQSKEKDKKDTQKFNYPQYMRSVHQNSASKIPKMIQQKINHQRSLYNKLSNEQSQNKSSSKLMRTSVQSKEKKSPYISQMEDNMQKLQSSTFPTSLMGKNTGFGHTLNSNKNGKQNLTATNGCARKLKRKAVVN